MPRSAAAACCGRIRSTTVLYGRGAGKQPRPRGPRLTIVTNAGGPGVLATDALIAAGGELATACARDRRGAQRVSARRIGATATRWTSSATPTPSATRKRWRSPRSDPDSDGLLVILTPQAMTDPTATAEQRASPTLRPMVNRAGQLDGRRAKWQRAKRC